MTDRRVLIIGLGLIGGSIALAIKKNHDATIIGYDVNHVQAKLAKSLNIIDEAIFSLEDGVKDASLIIIAIPVIQTENIMDELASLPLKRNVIITDVGSTKTAIVKRSAVFQNKNAIFIGGHPMAGSHKTGVAASKAHLFENAFYILTPSKDCHKKHVEELKTWLEGTKATFIEMTPTQHDKLVGMISHFPHIIAASLVQQLAKSEDDELNYSRFAAGGFRDITRIASSSPVMWRDILLHNKDILLALLDKWELEMQNVREMLEAADSEEIYNYFLHAKQYRDKLPERSKGAIPSFYDLFVDVEDYPGVIAHVTGILGGRDISITNIRIIETREDILGVLRLSFRSEAEREKAKRLLEDYRYETYILD
ncbi:prephenate dehydrogenase [Pueribacillus sp. YX66]|uniref:prephenate dehydrogenase n=1 Tax=Pueribacillus sp. YX66 TaxID=3229242 RepID=UPI00358D91AA